MDYTPQFLCTLHSLLPTLIELHCYWVFSLPSNCIYANWSDWGHLKGNYKLPFFSINHQPVVEPSKFSIGPICVSNLTFKYSLFSINHEPFVYPSWFSLFQLFFIDLVFEANWKAPLDNSSIPSSTNQSVIGPDLLVVKDFRDMIGCVKPKTNLFWEWLLFEVKF